VKTRLRRRAAKLPVAEQRLRARMIPNRIQGHSKIACCCYGTGFSHDLQELCARIRDLKTKGFSCVTPMHNESQSSAPEPIGSPHANIQAKADCHDPGQFRRKLQTVIAEAQRRELSDVVIEEVLFEVRDKSSHPFT
jgi:hypothetical protein